MSQPKPSDTQFATWVRNWVHYDNLTNNYGKQASGARKLRDDFETKIIQNLRANQMEKATIQITGAKLSCVEENCVPGLSVPRLEKYLHAYFQHKGNHLDETPDILKFIKSQKHNDTVCLVKLKKTPLGPALPPVPSAPPLH